VLNRLRDCLRDDARKHHHAGGLRRDILRDRLRVHRDEADDRASADRMPAVCGFFGAGGLRLGM
jgi:hypothetical protein